MLVNRALVPTMRFVSFSETEHSDPHRTWVHHHDAGFECIQMCQVPAGEDP